MLCGLARPAPGAEADRIDFNFQIRPLLSDRCFKCHGPDERARKKRLRLDTQEGLFGKLEEGWAVVRPGDTNRSELVRRILATDPEEMMPPPDSQLSLSAADKDLLRRWVAGGAPFKSHWSLIPVAKVTPPRLWDRTWARNPVDAFVRAKLDAAKLSPAPQAGREILLRRLALDLTGLPPTIPEQIGRAHV